MPTLKKVLADGGALFEAIEGKELPGVAVIEAFTHLSIRGCVKSDTFSF